MIKYQISLGNIKYLNYYFLFSGHDVTPITMALNSASAHPSACQALTSMLSKNSLNPADITVLYKNYNLPDAPPMDLIRTPQFLGNFQRKIYFFNFNLCIIIFS